MNQAKPNSKKFNNFWDFGCFKLNEATSFPATQEQTMKKTLLVLIIFTLVCYGSKALFSNISGNTFSLGSMVNYYYYHNDGTLVSVFKHKSYLHRHLSNVNVCRTYLRCLSTPNDVLLSNTYLRMIVT